MKTGVLCVVASVMTVLPSGRAPGATVDFDFTIAYSGASISGRLIGLALDANGNASEVDPVRVLLFHAPAAVGLAATPQNPYQFVPHTFQRSTPSNGTFSSTAAGVYGFQVSHYQIVPASQNLLMAESGNDVTLVFNYGQTYGYEGGTATYGIQAEEDALWPAVNCFVSFTLVAPTPCAGDADGDRTVTFADITTVLANFGAACGAGPAPCAGDADSDGVVNFADVTAVLSHWSLTCP